MTAPQYPPQPGYPPPQGTEIPARNPLGLVSVILGGIPLLFGVIVPFVILAITRLGDYNLIGIFSALFNGLAFVLGVAALVVGLFAITRKGLPKALAGIGTGLGIAAAWGGITAFLYPVVMQLVY